MTMNNDIFLLLNIKYNIKMHIVTVNQAKEYEPRLGHVVKQTNTTLPRIFSLA